MQGWRALMARRDGHVKLVVMEHEKENMHPARRKPPHQLMSAFASMLCAGAIMFTMTGNTVAAATDGFDDALDAQQNVTELTEGVNKSGDAGNASSEERSPVVVKPVEERGGEATPVLGKDGNAADADDDATERDDDEKDFPDIVTIGSDDAPNGVTESRPSSGSGNAGTAGGGTPSQDVTITVPRGMAGTLLIGGVQIPYVDCHGATVTPEHTAGIWQGANDLYDGGQGYFVGHNPGVFEPVAALRDGDVITVRTASGQQRDYVVERHWLFSNQSYYEDVEEQYLRGYGESIVLQTCMGDYDIKVVIARAR